MKDKSRITSYNVCYTKLLREIQELDTDMAELESLLTNASLEEEIEIEEL